jgi:hypothetical protein
MLVDRAAASLRLQLPWVRPAAVLHARADQA